jgi:hypothetical protein
VGRHEKQGVELHRSVHGDVHVRQGFGVVIGQEGVKLLVLLGRDLEFRLAPERGHGVHPFAVDQDGEGDEIGMALDDLLDQLRVRELGRQVGLEPHEDARAARGVRRSLGDGVGALPVRGPDLGRGAGLGASGGHLHRIRDHVHGVEAHAETADEVVQTRGAAVVLGLGHAAGELGRARVGDGADVLDQFLSGHADAVVGHRQGLGLGVQIDADGRGRVLGRVLAGRGGEALLVQCVGGVGDELAEEDFLVGVEGMDQDFEKLFDFRLEFEGRFRGAHAESLLE